MIAKSSDWYKYWDLGIKGMSWVENTEQEVEFIIKALGLTGKERILDLACGYGRHALSFARRGYQVTGVDLTKVYIEDGNKNAKAEGLDVQFIQSDIRDVKFQEEFDVVLSLADGAIGYLEDEEENLKIFDVISKALKPGGKHFMDIGNADYAEHYFPKTAWDMGEQSVSLSLFEWDKEKRIMLYGGWELPYGEPAKKPEILYGDPTRLYSVSDVEKIWSTRKMKVVDTYSTYDGKEASYKEYQLKVYSQKYDKLGENNGTDDCEKETKH